MSLAMCYLMGIPMIVWAVGLQVGLWGDDETRVPYLIVQAVTIFISVTALRMRYRRDGPARPDD